VFEKAKWSRNHWFAAIAIGITIWVIFAWVGPGDDYKRCYTWMVNEPWRLAQVVERPWTQNPPWLAPFMAAFVSLPGRAGYLVFMAFTIAVTIYGAYFFGGRSAIPALLSAHMMWILWWGQIEVWGVLGLILGAVALGMQEREKEQAYAWLVMFAELVMASFKPQISFVPVAMMWWWSGRQRWRSLAAMLVLFALSLFIWGPWPLWYIQSIFNFVGDQHAGPWSASIGLIALPLLIPALLAPLSREKRVIALAATAYLVSPYMPYYSTLPLLLFAVPWWTYIFAFTGYLPDLIGTRLAWNAIALMSILILVWIYWPVAKAWFEKKRRTPGADADERSSA
jgi:hypothetical protein